MGISTGQMDSPHSVSKAAMSESVIHVTIGSVTPIGTASMRL